MFDKKTVDAYKNIVPSNQLREKVLNAQIPDEDKSPKIVQMTKRRIALNYAAALVVLFGMAFSLVYLQGGNDSLVTRISVGDYNGYSTQEDRGLSSAYVEQESLEISFVVKPEKEAILNVTKGELIFFDSKDQKEIRKNSNIKIDTKEKVFWKIDDISIYDTEYLTVDIGNSQYVYKLSWDNKKEEWKMILLK